MSITIKDSPTQLRPEIVEEWWPGDTAVDLERSDLVAWARAGGSTGLVLKGDEKPAIIRWKALSEQALSWILKSMVQGSPNATDEAFRYGVISVEGFALSFGRDVDVHGLTDESLDAVSRVSAELPWLVMIDEIKRAQGDSLQPSHEDLMQVSLSKAVGAHILTRSFCERR